jgi:hypothetical protein
VPRADVELLLAKEARARLALHRQVRLYLDPFALFKDASSGPPPERARALSYNRAMRWMLVAYMRRWALLAATLFLATMPAEALAAQAGIFVVPAAALAVGSCVALAVIVVIAAVYLLLGTRQ